MLQQERPDRGKALRVSVVEGHDQIVPIAAPFRGASALEEPLVRQQMEVALQVDEVPFELLRGLVRVQVPDVRQKATRNHVVVDPDHIPRYEPPIRARGKEAVRPPLRLLHQVSHRLTRKFR